MAIMYVCDRCADGNEEACGHYDRSDLVVMPDGSWLCDECCDDDHTISGEVQNALSKPEEYGPIATLQRELEAANERVEYYRQRVVWCFSEDYPPTYHQGSTGEHELCEPVTAKGVTRLVSDLEAVQAASADLLADVRRRYPGEELRCPYMRALDAALDKLKEGR